MIYVDDPLAGGMRPLSQSPYELDHERNGCRLQRVRGGHPYCRDCERTVYPSDTAGAL